MIEPGESSAGMANVVTPDQLYLDLMIRVLANTIYGDPSDCPWRPRVYDEQCRTKGFDWPSMAHTMVGVTRLRQLKEAVETVLRENVPGDLLEAGVWRGGGCILMRAVLKAHGVTDRLVWVADSFAGLPAPNPEAFPEDAGDEHHLQPQLSVSMEQVQSNFDRYRLLDDRVRFLPGFFRDTMPTVPLRQLAVLRVDADMYESTWQVLEALVPRVSPGGFVIMDDFGSVPASRKAVLDYRKQQGIEAPIVQVDSTAVYWRVTGSG
jgi:O-methyltransferase